MSQAAPAPISAAMARPPALQRNVLASWIAHAAALGLGFFLMPYVMDVLGVSQYGDWVFINSFVVYGGLLYLGFGETVARFVARHQAEDRPERVNQVVSLVLVIYGLTGSLALFASGLLCWLAPHFGTWTGSQLAEIRIVILLLGLNFTVGMCGSVFGGVLLGLRRFDLERGVTIVSDLMRFGLIYFLLRREGGLAIIATIYLFITASEQIVLAVLAKRAFPALRPRLALVNWSVFRECSGFSALALVSHLAAAVINATDSIVIGLMLGSEAIVPYYIALRLTQFIRQPIEKVAHICMPTAGALAADPEPRRLIQLLNRASGAVLLLIGGMFVGGWFFGGRLIENWIGSQYAGSHRILCVLLGAQLVALPCGVFRAFLFGTGRIRAPALIYALEAGCNLGLSIALCHLWGIEGVAWGTALPAVAIELGLLLPYTLKTFGVTWGRFWNQSIRPQLVPLALLAAYSFIVARQPWSGAGWPALVGITLGGGAVLGIGWRLVEQRLRPES